MEDMAKLLENYGQGTGVIIYKFGDVIKHRYVVHVTESESFPERLRGHLKLVCPSGEFISCAIKTVNLETKELCVTTGK